VGQRKTGVACRQEVWSGENTRHFGAGDRRHAGNTSSTGNTDNTGGAERTGNINNSGGTSSIGTIRTTRTTAADARGVT
jgi:hypothetical protein